jgi:hypothetical protein
MLMPTPHTRARLAYLAVALAASFALLAVTHSPADRADPRKDRTSTCLLSPELPEDLCFDETGQVDDDRPAFNNFSWRNFIALNWPAHPGKRGKPDTSRHFGDKADQVVWGTWKSTDELYTRDHPPTLWDSFDATIVAHQFDRDGKLIWSPLDELPNKDVGRRKVLIQLARLGKINEAGFVAHPQGPLIAQNGTYVRYEVRVNRTAYEFLRKNQYYLAENLPSTKGGPAQPFPCGSVIVKAAWMELKRGDARERFHHVRGDVVEWTKDGRARLRSVVVGLVGLHIVHKTPSRPSWVWSTFEHVDNTEPGPSAARASFSRNDPTTPNDLGYDYQPEPISPRKPLPKFPRPVDVLRLTRIHSTTQTVNQRYHRLEGVRGTVWQNYRLVATQWVPTPDRGETAGSKVNPLPDGSVANTTLETYTQGSSCILCHAAGKAADFPFVFFPSLRALPSPPKK